MRGEPCIQISWNTAFQKVEFEVQTEEKYQIQIASIDCWNWKLRRGYIHDMLVGMKGKSKEVSAA